MAFTYWKTIQIKNALIMTSGLRKAHRYIWLILVIVIPVIIVFAIKDLQFTDTNTVQITTEEFTKKNAKPDFENEIIKVAFYPNDIELILKEPLKNASSTVYAIDGNNEKMVLGQLTTPGKYQFEVQNTPKNIMLYDQIKDSLITKTNF